MASLKDETGKYYGTWAVVGPSPRGSGYWLCRCDPDRGGCGTERPVKGTQLRNHTSTSCGGLCVHGKELPTRVGDLVIIKRAVGENVLVRCERTVGKWICGRKLNVRASELRGDHPRHCCPRCTRMVDYTKLTKAERNVAGVGHWVFVEPAKSKRAANDRHVRWHVCCRFCSKKSVVSSNNLCKTDSCGCRQGKRPAGLVERKAQSEKNAILAALWSGDTGGLTRKELRKRASLGAPQLERGLTALIGDEVEEVKVYRTIKVYRTHGTKRVIERKYDGIRLLKNIESGVAPTSPANKGSPPNPTPAPAKKSRGRPKGSKNKATQRRYDAVRESLKANPDAAPTALAKEKGVSRSVVYLIRKEIRQAPK